MTKQRGKVLVVDDEPEYLSWINDYFESIGFKTVFIENLADAITELDKNSYKIILVDMNIPSHGVVDPLLNETVFNKYPGLYLAKKIRTSGYSAYQVIGYTVHDDDAIEAELYKYNCRYVLKGRPNVLKSVITKSLEIVGKNTK